MKKCGLLLLAALCFILTACAAPEEIVPEEPQASVLGEAAGLSEEEPLLTVDGREVAAWRYLYWLAFTCDQIETRCQEAGTALDWSAPADGGTLADYAKQQALADTVLYATVENWAEDYRCSLEDADYAAVEAEWTEQAAAHGGEESYLAELARQGLNRARSDTLAETGQLYAKLSALYNAKEGPFEPPAPQPPVQKVDRILAAAGDGRAAARERIAELFSQLNTADDQAAAFTALAQASDDTAGPRTFTPGDGTFPASVEEAALALEPGQMSGIVESEEGFSILRRLEEDAPTPEEPEPAAFDQLLQAAAERAGVQTTTAYAQIDPAAFFRNLQAARAGRDVSSS